LEYHFDIRYFVRRVRKHLGQRLRNRSKVRHQLRKLLDLNSIVNHQHSKFTLVQQGSIALILR